ncbi:uncharacterized protein LOC124171705 isoform X1 [Ischnura elegans]|uniref:uncharacterized protein LOC124171705 isoform X1 n=1 Tax=Ischnura elegans TaxID=197161 RepID=UPI001ED89F01|nr:uncharacterized protein LOC124171705 isoform X1 [Ischnura elegans]
MVQFHFLSSTERLLVLKDFLYKFPGATSSLLTVVPSIMPNRKEFMSCSDRHKRRRANEMSNEFLGSDNLCLGEQEHQERYEVNEGSLDGSESQHEVADVRELPDSDVSVFLASDEMPSESESDPESDSETEWDPVDILDKLRQWAASGVTQTKVTEVLKILGEHSCFNGWPSDARTLLNTPRDTPTQRVAGGEYYHFGVESKLLTHLERYPQLKELEILKLHCCIDGVPLTKSTNSQLWPIALSFEDFPNIPPFLVGLFHGTSKPNSASEYFREFKGELTKIIPSGVSYNGRRFSIDISAYILDTPAFSFATQTASHTGYYSCRRCTTKGEFETSHVVFNDFDAALRTNESFRTRTQAGHHKGGSPLEEIPGTDMIKHFPYDYMHLTCLGIMRKILTYFMMGSLLVRLPSSSIEKMCQLLESLASSIPSEFPRKPRTLRELSRWKATELRQIMLYTGPYVFHKIVATDVFVHFLCFHYAMRCYVSDTYCQQRKRARNLMAYFVENFSKLYGKKSVSHNVHALIHLHSDVDAFGFLEKVNAFKFENRFQSLKKLVRKCEKPLQQIVRRESELALVPPKSTICPKNAILGNAERLPAGMSLPAYSKCVIHEVSIGSKAPNNCAILQDGSIVIVNCIATRENVIHIYGKKFKNVSNFYESPSKSSNVGIFIASDLARPDMWPLTAIRGKGIILPLRTKDGEQEFYVSEIIHSVGL